MTIQLLPASELPFDDVVHTFNRAYSDYFVPIHIESDAMRRTVRRDAIQLLHSWVALDQDRPIGVGMLALRDKAAWVGGLGIVPEWRGKGVGRQITNALIQSARQAEADYLQLEVIEHNQTAYQLYQSLNFKVTRRLLILEAPGRDFEAEIEDTYRVDDVSVLGAIQHYHTFHAQPNPWQRQHEALEFLSDSMDAWVATRNGEVVAYAVGWLTESVIRFMDVAVATGHEAALTTLLMHIHTLAPQTKGSITNLSQEDPTWPILEALGYKTTLSQWEMRLPLLG